MALSAQEKQVIVAQFQRKANDTGSPEVQVAILTKDIEKLTAHMKENLKDVHSRRGLLRKVSQRRSLLDYLKKHDAPAYEKLIATLGLRK